MAALCPLHGVRNYLLLPQLPQSAGPGAGGTALVARTSRGSRSRRRTGLPQGLGRPLRTTLVRAQFDLSGAGSGSSASTSPAAEERAEPRKQKPAAGGKAAVLAALEKAKAYRAAQAKAKAPPTGRDAGGPDGASGSADPSVEGTSPVASKAEAEVRQAVGQDGTLRELRTSGGAEGSGVPEPDGPGPQETSGQQGFAQNSAAAMVSEESYQEQQGEMVAALRGKKGDDAPQPPSPAVARSPPQDPPPSRPQRDYVEVEIITRDGIIRRQVPTSAQAFAQSRDLSPKGLSQLDFVGLGFEDKRDVRSTPAGLRAGMDAPSVLPEVEIITRDAGAASGAKTPDMYKPKVSTWGVFPRPKDISRTYGGGRTIRPGEALETDEEKRAREDHMRQVLANYRKQAGMEIDPKTQAECDAAMKAGSRLMDVGKLEAAQAQFEIVMQKTVFKSLLHGNAMLQKALCLDSRGRSKEARVLYEELISHPDVDLRKRGRQLLFTFKAAEELKVRSDQEFDSSVYKSFFKSSIDDYNLTYKATEEDGNDKLVEQSWPYALVLLFPFVLVYAAAALKGAI